jgi:pimeloyl-ACP methyl ester carboxylesterase
VISEAAAGVDHVRGLVYLCAFLLDAGESLLDALQHQVPDWIAIDEQAGTSLPLSPQKTFYADCLPAAADAAAARLVPHSVAAFAAPQTAAAWRERPSTYVICEQDQALPPAAQEAMSARASVVERLDRSHSPFLSAPDEVVAVLERALQTAAA